MGNKMNLADCVRLAEFAHFHQRDKSGAEYIEHPKRVLAGVQAQGAAPYIQMAAVLHDVTEDTPFTPEMLLDLGVPEAAVEIVKLVDRDYSARVLTNKLFPDLEFAAARGALSKSQMDAFYYTEIRKNPGAVVVKLSDIGDNLQPWRLSYLSLAKQVYLQEKYAKAIGLLS